jgi:hypothetical protein
MAGGVTLTKLSATPSTPATDKSELYLDANELAAQIDDAGQVRVFGQNSPVSIVAASAAINTTETIIVGGLNALQLKANSLKVGSTIRATLQGTCTSTAANASTWRARLGTAGTTADAAIASAANSVAAASGTNIPFVAELVLTVRTIGAAATLQGYLRLTNTGVTGISAVETQTVQVTASAFNSTVDNWLSFTYVSAATTTTSTFQIAFVEVVKI